MASVAMGVAQPAQASPPVVKCQAINATSIVGGSIPSPACYDSVKAGDSWEIDLSNIFAQNGGSLSVNDFYSLQIANINPSGTLEFKDVEFLVTGAIGSTAFTNQAITVWESGTTAPAFPFGQGVTDYSTNPTSNTFNTVPVSTKASFKLTSPQVNVGLGTAGLINTQAVQLSSAGITSFTGAKIRGKFVNSSNSFTGFSAGLASFGSVSATGAPTVIYGNAFNEVPGPLPIVGAGAAFGWSRKLRRRIGDTKKVAA